MRSITIPFLIFITLISYAGKSKIQRYEEIDNARYKAVYKLSFIEDTVKRKINSGYTMLLIGDSCSAYSTVNKANLDSACYTLWKAGASQDQIAMQAFKYAMGAIEIPTVYRGYPSQNEVTIDQYLIENSRYSEPVVAQEWTETGLTKDIKGLECRQAVCSFRGRDYVAYYSPEIPLSYGPYLFGGLPGLILELSDGNSEFVWTIDSFEPTTGFPIVLDNNKVKVMTRDEFRTIDYKLHLQPGLRFPFDKSVMSMPSKPYNPVEKY